MFKKIYDNTVEDSLATRMRRQRFRLFADMIAPLPRPLTILDLGGSQLYWERIGFLGHGDPVRIMLLNLRAFPSKHPELIPLAGDATNLSQFPDKSFDVVYSNSVIEHVGDYAAQQRMADEARRVGKRYFIQTPNRYFPIEPHFVFPLFQFLPLEVRIALLRRFTLGWVKRTPDREAARAAIEEIRLLTRRELQALFPDGTIYEEKILGLVKSFIIYGGWDGQEVKT